MMKIKEWILYSWKKFLKIFNSYCLLIIINYVFLMEVMFKYKLNNFLFINILIRLNYLTL